MSSTSVSPRQPPRAAHRERILTANVYISTLQFIAALLLLLMLLWHISTVSLIEYYQMPTWWVKLFITELASGWRVVVWIFVIILVPIDCLHALLYLDWWCLLLHGREGGDEKTDNSVRKNAQSDDKKTWASIHVHEKTYDRCRENHNRRTKAPKMSQLSRHSSSSSVIEATSVPSEQLSTYHPLLHRRFSPRTQRVLLNVLDIIMLAILAGHIISYFLSLSQYLVHCAEHHVASAPPLKFGKANDLLSARDRCIGLNVDIHVAGGFSTFMAIVLGILHIATLVVSVWERFQLGKDGVMGKASIVDGSIEKSRGKHDTASRTLETSEQVARSSSMPLVTLTSKVSVDMNSAASTITPRGSKSVSAEERSTDIRSMDRSAGRAERMVRCCARDTDASETEKEGLRWGEMLLECLTDA